MAGLEVITLVGLAAAVGQLTDYGYKFSRMVQDGRDAPVNARKFRAEAYEVHSLAQSISEGPWRYDNMQPFLEACLQESQDLMNIADDFIAHSDLYHSPKGLYRKIHSVLESVSDRQSVMSIYSTLPDSRHPLLGYERVLGNLRTALSDRKIQTRVVVAGLSGIGKSRLALAYGKDLKSSDPNVSVFWIRATQEQTLVHSYMEIAAMVGLSRQSSDQQGLVQDVLGFLESPGTASLLIYDNLGDSRNWSRCLEDYLPRTELCQAIFTVRDPKHGSYLKSQDTIINLRGLEPDAALELLVNNLSPTGVVMKDAAKLVSTLGYIPLAILQAASFISSAGITIQSYLSMLIEGSGQTEHLFREHAVHEFGSLSAKSFFETFAISLQNVKSRDPPAFNILCLMSCVHSSTIPLAFLVDSVDDSTPSRYLILLRDLSLIDFDDGFSASYGISPILQLLVRDHLKFANQYTAYLSNALRRILAYFPVRYRKTEDFSSGSECLSHAEELLKQEKFFGADSHSSLGDLSTRITSLMLEQGSLTVAKIHAEKATRFAQLAFGTNARETLKAKSDIAIILRRAGKLDEAEEMTIQILDQRTTLFGIEDLDTLASMNNLAIILRARGRHKDAEGWYRKAVETHNGVAGSESSDLMQALENLALTLQDQQKYDEANKLYQRVLSWRAQHFGESDSRTVSTKSNLGTLMQLEKQWEEAWTLQTEVFRSHTQQFGRMHPRTIKSQANLASIMHMQGYLQAAEPTMRQAVGHLRTVLGPDNQDTLLAMRNLAVLLRDLRYYEEASEVSWEVWNSSKTRFGPRHPETVASKEQKEEMEWYRRKYRADPSDVD
ncbi:hypothetical protein E8E14_011631 [Neopestalotiopsis sp. 37M]|nr:hypothetical protein E8E14_011631 [Neopestalotiopsis sp. 37M]